MNKIHSFRKAFYHLQMALDYFEDTNRTVPLAIAGKLSVRYASRLKWIINDFATSPKIPSDAAGEFKSELEPKQETTLEEAAERYLQEWRLLNNIHLSNPIHAERCKNDFKAGAKWQQQQDSGKDTADYIDKNLVQALVEVAKQNPTMYSEEDLKEAFEGGGKMCWSDIEQESQEPYYYDFKEWFEQFKKK